MAKLTINEERCKGCSLCISVCPRGILKLSDDFNAKGYNALVCTDQERCTGCAMCAIMCPDVVIKVER